MIKHHADSWVRTSGINMGGLVKMTKASNQLLPNSFLFVMHRNQLPGYCSVVARPLYTLNICAVINLHNLGIYAKGHDTATIQPFLFLSVPLYIITFEMHEICSSVCICLFHDAMITDNCLCDYSG
jgi:hypothetical protein